MKSAANYWRAAMTASQSQKSPSPGASIILAGSPPAIASFSASHPLKRWREPKGSFYEIEQSCQHNAS